MHYLSLSCASFVLFPHLRTASMPGPASLALRSTAEAQQVSDNCLRPASPNEKSGETWLFAPGCRNFTCVGRLGGTLTRPQKEVELVRCVAGSWMQLAHLSTNNRFLLSLALTDCRRCTSLSAQRLLHDRPSSKANTNKEDVCYLPWRHMFWRWRSSAHHSLAMECLRPSTPLPQCVECWHCAPGKGRIDSSRKGCRDAALR